LKDAAEFLLPIQPLYIYIAVDQIPEYLTYPILVSVFCLSSFTS